LAANLYSHTDQESVKIPSFLQPPKPSKSYLAITQPSEEKGVVAYHHDEINKISDQIQDQNQGLSRKHVEIESNNNPTQEQEVEIHQSTQEGTGVILPVDPIENQLALPEIDPEVFFKTTGITPLHQTTSRHTANLIFKSLWQQQEQYANYLISYQGDFDVNFSEWAPFFQREITDDICNFSFQFSRQGSYLHPRTSMLMFG